VSTAFDVAYLSTNMLLKCEKIDIAPFYVNLPDLSSAPYYPAGLKGTWCENSATFTYAVSGCSVAVNLWKADRFSYWGPLSAENSCTAGIVPAEAPASFHAAMMEFRSTLPAEPTCITSWVGPADNDQHLEFSNGTNLEYHCPINRVSAIKYATNMRKYYWWKKPPPNPLAIIALLLFIAIILRLTILGALLVSTLCFDCIWKYPSRFVFVRQHPLMLLFLFSERYRQLLYDTVASARSTWPRFINVIIHTSQLSLVTAVLVWNEQLSVFGVGSLVLSAVVLLIELVTFIYGCFHDVELQRKLMVEELATRRAQNSGVSEPPPSSQMDLLVQGRATPLPVSAVGSTEMHDMRRQMAVLVNEVSSLRLDVEKIKAVLASPRS
jgi:hypothetical protein